MGTLRPLVTGFLLFAFFAIAFISAYIQLATDNEATQSLGDDPAIIEYAQALNESVADAQENSNSAEEAISESPVTFTALTVVINSVASVWKTMTVIPKTIYNVTIGFVVTKLFPGNEFQVNMAIIGALLVLAIVVAVIKFTTQGEGG